MRVPTRSLAMTLSAFMAMGAFSMSGSTSAAADEAASNSTPGERAAATAAPGETATDDGTFDEPDKSFAVYIGKNRTEDGYTMLGGFGHEPSSHWLEVVPAQDHPKGSEITVGADETADMPGKLTSIPQVEHTYRYITSNYSEFTGLPAPLMNGGLNEKGVAARDVWSNSRPELVDMTPEDQTGPQYSDLSRIAMERAGSAREAVEILGSLIDEYGYTTYGGNSHLFADENEGWVFIEMAGGQGLWAAERLGPDDVRVSYPGYIHEFPVDAVNGENPDYLGSANLVSFAEEQGWYDPETDDEFNVQKVYQEDFPTGEFEVGQDAAKDDPAPYRNPVSLEKEFEQFEDVKLEDVMRIVRDPRWSDDRSGYGHVAQLPDDLDDPEKLTLWVAVTAAVTAPYIPVSIGTTELPIEYSQHRYLTAGASANYLDPEFAEQEATEYATQTFKRLMYATCSRPDAYLSDVTSALEGFEAQSISTWKKAMSDAADADELTDITNDSAIDGLKLGHYLLDDILTQSMADGGIHEPDVEGTSGETASSRSLPMDLRSDTSSRDRMNCDMGGGWADGSALDRAGTYGNPDDVPDYSSVSLPGHPAEVQDAAATTPWMWGVGGVAAGLVVGIVVMLLIGRSRRSA
ncbi:C69 family dipeptidase [Paramicrobacterium sp. CJ85]|uniref:C69 family dipeptidase n=1 Tax=Paramicrobacterium sp. CJ85 TaxID=3445355 RepID=UPI003F5F256B